MPRPKRTKVAPSAPVPRVRQSTKAASPHVAAAKEPFNDLYDVSDAEQGVGPSARRVKKDNDKGKAVASLRRASRTRQSLRDSADRDAQIVEKGRERDIAQSEEPMEESLLPEIDLESSSPAVEMGRRERNSSAVESSVLAIGNFRRRPRQRSILGRGPGRARSSSLDSNLAEDNGLMSVGRKNASALKRRPQETSTMGRNAATVAPSSMALEMEKEKPAHVGSAMKIGAFKRREREPSILRTAQKSRPQPQLDYDDEDEDDFNPVDESTPLNLSKTRNMASSSSGPSSSNSRKRKLSVVQAPRSSPPLLSPEIDADETIPATYPSSDEEDREEAEHSLPEHPMPSIEARDSTPEAFSETMAPPQSSSSSSSALSSPIQPLQPQRASSRGRRPLRGRTPPPRTQDSPISSPPSLTHSPNRSTHAVAAAAAVPTTRKARKPVPPPSTFSTAQLQALLPRRRTRHASADPFDIPSSEEDDEVDVSRLASDDDELSHLHVPTRARRRGASIAQVRTPAPLKRGPKASKQAAAAKPKSAVKRTYGARAAAAAASDKENEVDTEVDPDDSLAPVADDGGSAEDSQELERRVGRELKQAARKFQEVDKWELEFEEITASSSSPADAR